MLALSLYSLCKTKIEAIIKRTFIETKALARNLKKLDGDCFLKTNRQQNRFLYQNHDKYTSLPVHYAFSDTVQHK